MRRFRRKPHDIEQEIRDSRPQPPAHLLASIGERTRVRRPARGGRVFRAGFAGALTAALLVSLSLVGALGAAGTGVQHAAKATYHLVSPQQVATSHQSSAATRSSRSDATRSTNSHGDDPGEGRDPGDHQYHPHKVLVCLHGFVNIFVDEHAVPALLAHGATLGECPHGHHHFPPRFSRR